MKVSLNLKVTFSFFFFFFFFKYKTQLQWNKCFIPSLFKRNVFWFYFSFIIHTFYYMQSSQKYEYFKALNVDIDKQFAKKILFHLNVNLYLKKKKNLNKHKSAHNATHQLYYKAERELDACSKIQPTGHHHPALPLRAGESAGDELLLVVRLAVPVCTLYKCYTTYSTVWVIATRPTWRWWWLSLWGRGIRLQNFLFHRVVRFHGT